MSYLWSNGAITQDISSLTAGVYSLLCTDTFGCTISQSFTIFEPSILSTQNILTDVSCFGFNDGSIDLFLAGGTGTLTPSWTTLVAGNGIVANDTNQTGLGKGSYKVVVSDLNSCKDSVNFNIEESDTISITSALSDVQCADSTNGSINVNSSGGTGLLVASWSSLNPLFTDPGIFKINALDLYHQDQDRDWHKLQRFVL